MYRHLTRPIGINSASFHWAEEAQPREPLINRPTPLLTALGLSHTMHGLEPRPLYKLGQLKLVPTSHHLWKVLYDVVVIVQRERDGRASSC